MNSFQEVTYTTESDVRRIVKEELSPKKEKANDFPHMVQITSSEYERLLERSDWLGYLEAAGVDNWQGIDFAAELKREDEQKEREQYELDRQLDKEGLSDE